MGWDPCREVRGELQGKLETLNLTEDRCAGAFYSPNPTSPVYIPIVHQFFYMLKQHLQSNLAVMVFLLFASRKSSRSTCKQSDIISAPGRCGST